MAQRDRSNGLSRRNIIVAGLGLASACGIGSFAGIKLIEGNPVPTESARPASQTFMPVQPEFDYRVENLKPGTPRSQVPTRWDSSTVISGYLGEHASTPDTRTISVFVSSTLSSIHIYAYRLGHYAGLGQRLIWKSPAIPVQVQSAPVIEKHTKMVMAQWSATTTVNTSSWPEGFYYLLLSGGLARIT